MLQIILYGTLFFVSIYLVKNIKINLIKHIAYLKDKTDHDKKSKECFDYSPDFTGRPCGRAGCSK